MVSRTVTRLALATALLGALGGCQQPVKTVAPGPAPRLNATTYFAHAHLLESQGNFEGAVLNYRRALALQPKFLTASNRLGITLNKLAQHREASEQFRAAIAQAPGKAYLHNNLGFSLYLEGKYEQSERVLVRALDLKPSFARARMNHALALGKLGRFEESYAELLRAGGEADALYNMAAIQTDAELFADAAQSLEKALTINPKFEAARRQLHQVARLAAENEAERARELASAQTVADVEPEIVAEPDAAEEPIVAEAPMTDDELAESEFGEDIGVDDMDSGDEPAFVLEEESEMGPPAEFAEPGAALTEMSELEGAYLELDPFDMLSPFFPEPAIVSNDEVMLPETPQPVGYDPTDPNQPEEWQPWTDPDCPDPEPTTDPVAEPATESFSHTPPHFITRLLTTLGAGVELLCLEISARFEAFMQSLRLEPDAPPPGGFN
jgi:tetratricopeptide (TPR) repeat protein